jgi:organic hydroperoxide reductase OsmC/OhrA
MENHYLYRVNASSTALRGGIVVAEDVEPSITFSAPPEFQGERGLWTPEHFFLASVAGCFISTFSGISHFSKFEFLSLELETEGLIAKDEGGWRFTNVTLRPRLKIAHEKDRERAGRLLEKAERSCLVVRSLTTQVTLEPEIVLEEEFIERQKMGNSVPIT